MNETWTGTEKQIAWAQDIKDGLLPEVNALAKLYNLTTEEIDYLDGGKGMDRINEFDAKANEYGASYYGIIRVDEKYRARVTRAVAAINECMNAKWFIDFGRSTAEFAIKSAMGQGGMPGGRLI
jgi:hypothetical protein